MQLSNCLACCNNTLGSVTVSCKSHQQQVCTTLYTTLLQQFEGVGCKRGGIYTDKPSSALVFVLYATQKQRDDVVTCELLQGRSKHSLVVDNWPPA